MKKIVVLFFVSLLATTQGCGYTEKEMESWAQFHVRNGDGWIDKNSLNSPEYAINEYKKALKFNPRCAVAYVGMGIAYTQLDKLDKAIDAHNKAIDVDPRCADAYLEKGKIYQQKKKLDKAIDAYTKAINTHHYTKSKNDFRVLYLYRAEAHLTNNDINNAIADYDKIIAHEPKLYRDKDWRSSDAIRTIDAFYREMYTVVYFNRAVVYHNIKNFHKAIQDYTKAINLTPCYARAYRGRSLSYKSIGDEFNSLADMETYNDLPKSDHEALWYLWLRKITKGY